MFNNFIPYVDQSLNGLIIHKLPSSLHKIENFRISSKFCCISFFQNVHHFKIHNNIFFLKKAKYFFKIIIEWFVFFALTGDSFKMQFTRGLVSLYFLNWLQGKQSTSCMVISLDLTKILFGVNGFQKVSINEI